MLVDETVSIDITSRNINYYKDKNYNVINGQVAIIKTVDLNPNTKIKIKAKCTICGDIITLPYCKYLANLERQGYYGCKKCSTIKKETTFMANYGVSNPMKSKEIQDKGKQTKFDKYGDENYNNNEKHIQTNIERYGVEHHLQNKNIYNKLKETCLEKYGVDHASKTDFIKDKIKKSNYISKLNLSTTIYKEKHNIDILDKVNDEYTIHCNKCNNNYNIRMTLLQMRLLHNCEICIICNPLGFGNTSQQEHKLLDFIKDNYKGEIIANSKSIIYPYELDIYLPELNIAFEYNGVYWHNELNKPNDYHKVKTDMCIIKGIQLIHIWEDDWNYKKDIVKSMILNKIGLTTNKIFARKCDLKEITDNRLVVDFLNNNHIQGFSNSSIKLGLFYNGELVSLMTFGKLRKIMNMKSNDSDYELIRFCNKLNTNIIGGASKLFKHFLKNNIYDNILSYADLGYSNGNLYKTLGFFEEKITEPNYYYVIDNVRKHRFNYRKSKLVNDGFDPNLTEHEIMLSRKYYRIYNSGNIKFLYKNND